MQVIYGKDEALVEQEALKSFPTARIIRNNGDLAQILQDACSANLFSGLDWCIVANCGFITAATVSKNDKNAVSMLADLDSSRLVLLAEGEKLTSEATVSKAIKKAKVKKVAALSERTVGAKIAEASASQGVKLTEGAVTLLIDRLPLSWGIIKNELEKIANLGKKEVAEEDIGDLVSRYSDQTVLDWVDASLQGDGKRCLALYQEIKLNGTEEGEMLGVLASQLVFIKNAIIQYKTTPSADAVAAALNANPFRIRKSLELIAGGRLAWIDKLIDLTYRYDILVKEGALNKVAAMHAFIMETDMYGRKH